MKWFNSKFKTFHEFWTFQIWSSLCSWPRSRQLFTTSPQVPGGVVASGRTFYVSLLKWLLGSRAPILFAELCQSKLVWKTKPFSLNKIGRHFTLKSCHRWNNKSKMGFQLLTLYCIVEPFLSPKYVHLTSVTIYHQKIKEDCICPKFHQFLFAVILISYSNYMFLSAIIFLTYRLVNNLFGSIRFWEL